MHNRRARAGRIALFVAVVGTTAVGVLTPAAASGGSGGHANTSAVSYMKTVGAAKGARGGGGGGGSNLTYHGGVVETPSATVYLVAWGSQWNNNDPSGEITLLQSFLGDVGGSSWLASVKQYCQGVASGATSCPSGSAFADGRISLGGTWYDNGSAAPSHPSQNDLAAEAVRAASHFPPADTTKAQYVIATATGNNASGFGSNYCAWHSSTTSGNSNIAYTNLPYITDAGASCGANFNGLGPKAGITIVEGHELAETITDQFPNGGWLDRQGAENGDKCAWISSGPGASASVKIGSGTYPVQSLWSNAISGCTLG